MAVLPVAQTSMQNAAFGRSCSDYVALVSFCARSQRKPMALGNGTFTPAAILAASAAAAIEQKYLLTLNSFAIPAIACFRIRAAAGLPIDASAPVLVIIAHRDLRGRAFGGGSIERD